MNALLLSGSQKSSKFTTSMENRVEIILSFYIKLPANHKLQFKSWRETFQSCLTLNLMIKLKIYATLYKCSQTHQDQGFVDYQQLPANHKLQFKSWRETFQSCLTLNLMIKLKIYATLYKCSQTHQDQGFVDYQQLPANHKLQFKSWRKTFQSCLTLN